MESHREETLNALGALLSYPTESYLQAAEMLFVVLHSPQPEAAKCISKFARYVEPRSLHELEELFARTFDVNPTCALEIGWHLFGEDYARGALLVRLRGEMRQRGIEESAELPDHIAHVLSLVAVMPDEEAQRLVQACVLPAVDKMQKALDEAETEYRHVMRCLVTILEREFGRALDSEAGSPIENKSTSPDPTEGGTNPFKGMQGDPLRDYPAPCGSQMPSFQMPSFQMPSFQMPGSQMPGSQMPGSQTPGTQTPGSQTPGSQTPVELIPLYANFHDNPNLESSPELSQIPNRTPDTQDTQLKSEEHHSGSCQSGESCQGGCHG